jgi:hypothetical protein
MLFVACAAFVAAAPAQEPVEISSPGLSSSRMDRHGVLIEDWGTVDVQLSGEGIAEGTVELRAVQLNERIPAAQAVSDHGAVRLTRTAYRAPIFPAGVDVLTVEVADLQDSPRDVLLTLKPSAGSKTGARSVRIGGRVVVLLPHDVADNAELREWGFCDEASALPGWAKPQGNCDAAFRNIRAGMGGVPIVYRFSVTPGSQSNVMLGICESHWAEPGQRPLRCQVEGADSQTIDPVAKWGQHVPGILAFDARDTNGDGWLQISVRSAPHAPDTNPILNAIWIYPADDASLADQVLAGTQNDAALYYVDVGGQNDQSIYPPGKLEFPLPLPAGGSQRLTFLVACPGGAAPLPETSTWDEPSLLRAAYDVWRDWPVAP